MFYIHADIHCCHTHVKDIHIFDDYNLHIIKDKSVKFVSDFNSISYACFKRSAQNIDIPLYIIILFVHKGFLYFLLAMIVNYQKNLSDNLFLSVSISLEFF